VAAGPCPQAQVKTTEDFSHLEHNREMQQLMICMYIADCMHGEFIPESEKNQRKFRYEERGKGDKGEEQSKDHVHQKLFTLP
jgi:hypothetical protein